MHSFMARPLSSLVNSHGRRKLLAQKDVEIDRVRYSIASKAKENIKRRNVANS